MNLIVAVDEKFGIGKDGDLLCHLSNDLKYFKEKTSGKVVVMGKKTLKSLPKGKPLPNRKNIVLSACLAKHAKECGKTHTDINEEITICKDRQELMAELENYDTKDVFIIGGAQVYTEFMDDCSDFYVTMIEKTFDADKYIKDITKIDGIELVWESERFSENGINYTFRHYRRK